MTVTDPVQGLVTFDIFDFVSFGPLAAANGTTWFVVLAMRRARGRQHRRRQRAGAGASAGVAAASPVCATAWQQDRSAPAGPTSPISLCRLRSDPETVRGLR
jgi:hypothetical protein